MNEPKPLSEYTDRELLEIVSRNTKETARNSRWIKNFLIVVAAVIVAYFVLAIVVIAIPFIRGN
jgi:hypothetical protein